METPHIPDSPNELLKLTEVTPKTEPIFDHESEEALFTSETFLEMPDDAQVEMRKVVRIIKKMVADFKAEEVGPMTALNVMLSMLTTTLNMMARERMIPASALFALAQSLQSPLHDAIDRGLAHAHDPD